MYQLPRSAERHEVGGKDCCCSFEGLTGDRANGASVLRRYEVGYAVLILRAELAVPPEMDP
jgi:hypothetical protein